MKFRDYSEKYQKEILVLHQPASQVVMRSHLKTLNSFFGDRPLSDLSVQGFFTQESKNLTPKSLKNLWSTMRLVLTQAVNDGLIDKLPQPVLPKVRRHQQPWLTADEMKLLINSARDRDDALLYRLLAETGLRIGEALAITKQDVKESSLKIDKSLFSGKYQSPKTDSANRTLGISTQLILEIGDQLTGDQKILFPNKHSRPRSASSVLSGSLHPLLKKLGLPQQGFHSFRRGNATIMATIGVPEKIAAYRLGHALPGLTFGLYAQNVQKMDEPWVEKIGEQLR